MLSGEIDCSKWIAQPVIAYSTELLNEYAQRWKWFAQWVIAYSTEFA